MSDLGVREPAGGPASIDHEAVGRTRRQPMSWADKGIPTGWYGRTPADLLRTDARLGDLAPPVLVIDASAMRDNIATLARWCALNGTDLAPHGKTSMAPHVWAEQIRAGAWGITVANPAQLSVARAFGVSRVIVANSVVNPLALQWISDQLAADPGFEVFVWADDERTVSLMDAALAAGGAGPARRKISVLVEVGGRHGRTGARSPAHALAVAAAITASPHLELAGTAGYEAVFTHDVDPASLDVVRGYLRELVEVHEVLAAAGLLRHLALPVVTAGGSTYFDLVSEELAPLAGRARIVLRSGAYVVHDDGFCDRTSPLGSSPRAAGGRLVAAMHCWSQVISQPETGLALLNAGKRDLPYDLDLPVPQLVRRPPDRTARPLPSDVHLDALNDQHAFLRFSPDGPSPVEIGDWVRLGLSHPCTAFDKWRLIPVVEGAEPDARIADFVRTYF